MTRPAAESDGFGLQTDDRARSNAVVCAVLSATVFEQAVRISAEDSGRYRPFGDVISLLDTADFI